MSYASVPRPALPVGVPLTELAGLVGGRATGTVEVTGVTHDSSAIRPGDLFAGLPGARTHGARFAARAAEAGAAAVLTDAAGADLARDAGLPVLVVEHPRVALGTISARVYGDPSATLAVVGITGTNGKTTTAYLVEAGLRAAGHTTALLGTVETRIAGERLQSVRTTPEAPDLQALLAVAKERGVTAVVMEVSSHALALDRVAAVRFAVGAFTNLGVDHLDFHADLEDYFQAKARLFDGRSAAEVVNVDDAAGRRLARPDTVTVSAAGAPDARWRVVERGPDGFVQDFTVVGPDGVRTAAQVAMPGAYSVENAVLAVAILETVGVPLPTAVEAVAHADQVPGRMERVPAPETGRTGKVADASPVGVVDYAHDPGSVAAALAALRPVTPGRLICVLGCGGDRDAGKRPLMGEAAARGADVFVATDDNPRSEQPAMIRAAMLAGVARVPTEERAEVIEVGDRAAAIAAAVERADAGDCVAVLGKGHEQGQEVAGVVHPFDDRDVLAAALAARTRGARA
ncbi:UDP-N-acetylmuramoyl-L-alanyl-D-glutamate--2,6-diaminopimelate ligase [Cryptosporangium aurantiacum]|uniref:UDP-N-acetylmuramoyl-L-alanyl-D-glutamate--2,6-diaminopimelate ligase n=1 Tax=Cryptosporangium aurantiacum TaxID=134849 RepID=A0A1M7I5B8_9ACTN|nr:UDP-N-acetylmuramoyl-L-alanyl-D-glutamate--2,6-diaminopimelate ligase [Cryptosporangium aurantiacum]SHM35607.1 UDP-N-acetylmuramoylalanyl-D-glutamate--2,6-diaminopimelate ligase [Cryptosporangium aurantiacum]